MSKFIRATLALILAFACQSAPPAAVLLGPAAIATVQLWSGCVPYNPAGGSVSVGGMPGTGGAKATGGKSGTGGAKATGGKSGTGGANVAVLPGCNTASMAAPSPAQIEQHRKALRPRHKLATPALSFTTTFTAVPATVMWGSNDSFCGDQGSVGACVAFAALSVATSQPRAVSFTTATLFNSAALNAYTWITNNDPYPGAWPAQDTGSDTLTGCKWLLKTGYAVSCTVITGKTAVLAALQSGPVMSGMNWLSSMFTTDLCGHLTVSGTVEGGHDVELVGYDASTDEVIQQTNWGNTFGVHTPNGHGGYMRIKSTDQFGATLDADFVVPR
jgi:hypothetical protein